MAVDSKFLEWIEQNFPGRDIPAHNDEDLHRHGTSTVRHGRGGAVLTVDLTNRCNMMCDPCFMDANQVGYVHELGWEEIQEILDNATKIKPRARLEMSVQFSGGEPTMHILSSLTPCATPARLATTAFRQRQTASSLRSAGSSAARHSKRGCAMHICSSMASAMTPIATARSATCSM